MGTRNLTIVRSDGVIKVAQYGQWDGNPKGQGQTIAYFLNKVDLKKFKERVNKLQEYTKEDLKEFDAIFEKPYIPALDRDVGAGILDYINDEEVKKVYLKADFKEDTIFCEYWYEIDLDKQTVTMNNQTFTFEEWTKEGFMEQLERQEQEDSL